MNVCEYGARNFTENSARYRSKSCLEQFLVRGYQNPPEKFALVTWLMVVKNGLS